MTFFVLASKLASKTLLVSPKSLPAALGTETVGAISNLRRGLLAELEEPVTFHHKTGTRADDLLDTGFVSLYLISNKFRDILDGANVCGWQPFAAMIQLKNGSRLDGYCGLSITGKCEGMGPNNLQYIFSSDHKPGHAKEYYTGVNVTGWDGSDLFLPEDKECILVTEKVATLLHSAKLTNVLLLPLKEI